jgi:hypothetical protein
VQKSDRNAARRSSGAMRQAPLLTIGLLGLILSLPSPAAAQDSGRRAEQAAGRSDKDAKSRADVKSRAVTGPLYAVVSIGDQRISIYNGEGLVTRAPVSTGMRGHPTPTGVFSIVQKKRWHRSNIYSGAPMPFMQRITWSGIAMHAGALPGYPASHGCIRLPGEFASRLFGMTEMGQRVIISPHDVSPETIAHKNLPAPYLWPAEALEARAAPGETTAAIADARKAAGVLEQVSLTDAPVEARGMNPLEYARNMKQQANEKARLAARSMKAAHIQGVRKAAELRMAHRRLDAAESAAELAADKLAAAMRKLAKVDDEDFVKAAEGIAALKAALGEAKAREDEARAARLAGQHELAASRREAQQARSAGKAAAAALVEANRRLRPLSVFISRKTGRLYARQDWKPLFDAPVTIRDAERPIGTHVYIGTHAAENGSGLIWSALSMPPEAPAEPKRPRGSGNEAPAPAAAPAPALPPETAVGALDRVAIPEDAARRMAELSWVGASIIISDHGISGETGETTDFIILTRSRAAAR